MTTAPSLATSARAPDDQSNQLGSSDITSSRTLASTSVARRSSAISRERHDLLGAHGHVAPPTQCGDQASPAILALVHLAQDDGVALHGEVDDGSRAQAELLPDVDRD